MAASPGGKEVARVSVRAVPDTSHVRAELKAQLDAIEKDSTLKIPVSLDLEKASLELDKFHEKWSGKNIDLNVNAETDGANAHLDELAAKRKINFDSSDLSKAVSGVVRLSSVIGSLLAAGGRLAIVSIGIAAIGAAAINAIGKVGALVVSLGRLSGAAALIPGALGGLGAVLGTTKAAFSGVGAALSAATSSTTSGGNALAGSERGLASAQTQEKTAQEALTQARKDAAAQLQSLSNQLTDAQLSERQNALDLASAQDALASTSAASGASPQQQAQAQLSYDQAVQALKEQQEQVKSLKAQKASADKAGIAGSQAVLQAQQQLASGGGGGSTNAYAAALAKLSTNARSAVQTLLLLRGRLSGVREEIQQNFFAGFSKSMLGLSAIVLPQLRSGLGSLSTDLGGLSHSLFDAVGASVKGGALTLFLKNVALGIKDLQPAVGPFVKALVTLITVGGQFLPGLATGFANAAKTFSSFISGAAASGKLQSFIKGGLTGFQQLGHVFSGFGAIFAGLFKSLSGTGADPLTTLAGGLHAIAAIVNGKQFQKTLSTIFSGAAVGAHGLAGALAPIGHLLAVMAPTLSKILSGAGKTVGKLLGDIASALAQPAFQKGLGAFFTGIEKGLLALGPSLPSLAQALGTIGTSLGSVFAALGPQLVTLLPAVTSLIKNLLPQVVADLQILLPILAPFLAATLTNLSNILAVGKPFIDLFEKWFVGGKQVSVTMEALNGKLGPFLQYITTTAVGFGKFVSVLITGAKGLASGIGTAFSAIGSVVHGAVSGMLDFFYDFLNASITGLNQLIGLVNTVAKGAAAVSGGTIKIKFSKVPLLTVPSFAGGGNVPSSPGGSIVRLSEAGFDESVVKSSGLNALIERVLASAQGTSSNEPVDRPIYADGIGLLGWLREVAGKQAEFVFNKALNSWAVDLGTGGVA